MSTAITPMVHKCGTTEEYFRRMLKKAVQQAAASEEARRTLRYVEPLSDARTPLADFFSILLERDRHPFFSSARAKIG